MIRDLAARRGLTLRQVAQRAGIAEGTLYNAVKQSNARPLSIGSIGRIANAFGVTIEELVGEESAPDVVSETITDDSPEAQRLHAVIPGGERAGGCRRVSFCERLCYHPVVVRRRAESHRAGSV